MAGVAAGSQDHAGGAGFPPLRVLPGERAFDGRFQEIEQIRAKPADEHLGLGVAPPAVELEDFRPFRREHQSREKHPAIFDAVFFQPGDKALEDAGFHPVAKVVVERAGGADRAHAAGIRAPVAIQRPLVIPAVGKKQERRAVHEGVDRAFGPLEKFLDHDLAAGVAEHSVVHALPDRLLRLGRVLRDDDPFAEREPVGLDDQRVFCAVAPGASSGAVGELPVIRRGNSMAAHEILREGLRGFQPRGRSARAKNFQAVRLERVRDPEGERVVRPDHRETDTPGFCEVHKPGDIVRGERDIFPQLRGARISGCAKNFGNPGRLGQFPSERVLASAGADDEEVHDPKTMFMLPRKTVGWLPWRRCCSHPPARTLVAAVPLMMEMLLDEFPRRGNCAAPGFAHCGWQPAQPCAGRLFSRTRRVPLGWGR